MRLLGIRQLCVSPADSRKEVPNRYRVLRLAGGPASAGVPVGSASIPRSTPLALTAGSPAITLPGADDVASRVCSTGSMSGRKFIQSLAKK